MALLQEPSTLMRERYCLWVEAQTEKVRAVFGRFEPWQLYRLAPSGWRVFVVGWCEDADDPDAPIGLIVIALARQNLTANDVRLSSVEPERLTPCDPLSDAERALFEMEASPAVN